MRQISLVAFLQAQNCTTHPASWRYPESADDFTTPEYFRRIARTLEAGTFDLGFFDDRLAMPDLYSGDHGHTVANGIRCVKMDPITVLMTMGMATEKLGLGATYSTTYYEPFHVARVFATLDLMTEGRAAWNVVTSLNDNEARNMGRDEVAAHDERYDRADEFLEIVHGHWDTWEDDSLVVDKESGLFAHAEKVHRLDHEGKYFKSRGPFTVPRSPQGHPVVIQAGQSGRGRRFAAEWGELIFVAYPDLEFGKKAYGELKENAAKLGRDPDQMRIASLTYPIIGESMGEAEDKAAVLHSLVKEIDVLSLLSEALNYDFAAKDMDEAFTTEELENISGLHAIRDRVLEASGNPNPTVRDFIHHSGRGQMKDTWVGGPKEIADRFEEWFTTPACDGFVIGGTITPGTFDDMVEYVIPELRRRGLYRADYTGKTLRDHLGLSHPVLGGWKH